MSSGRIAGDNPTYSFRLCRVEEYEAELSAAQILADEPKRQQRLIPTDMGFEFVSVSTFLGDVMGKPAGAMAWWGYRVGLAGVAAALAEDPEAFSRGRDLPGLDAEQIEAVLKLRGVSPNTSLETAGDRGNEAHGVLEDLAAQNYDRAEKRCEAEEKEFGTRYGHAVMAFWKEEVQPYIDSGDITKVLSEYKVWSISCQFAGTFDLGLLWDIPDEGIHGWTIEDLKTHKPAQGFTLPGKGPGYVSEAAQNRAYRIAVEEMGMGPTIGQRVIVARDKSYPKTGPYLLDTREVSADFVIQIRQAYEAKHAFEEGDK